MSAAAGATAQARAAEQKLSPPLVINASDAVTSVANTVSNQMDLATSIGSLLAKVEVLVKVGDEIAKVCSAPNHLCTCTVLRLPQIHPYVNFAWQVLSAGLKVRQIRPFCVLGHQHVLLDRW